MTKFIQEIFVNNLSDLQERTDTSTFTDEAVIVEENIHPVRQCEFNRGTRCQNRASWIMMFPCCGVNSFFCTEHKNLIETEYIQMKFEDDGFTCYYCDKDFENFIWDKI